MAVRPGPSQAWPQVRLQAEASEAATDSKEANCDGGQLRDELARASPAHRLEVRRQNLRAAVQFHLNQFRSVAQVLDYPSRLARARFAHRLRDRCCPDYYFQD